MYDDSSDENRDIVLVTGASGLLGQHIVKLLQEKDDAVDEIRCFDLKPYQNKLEHSTAKPMKIMMGDLACRDDIVKAMEGVKWVINCAQVSRSQDPNEYTRANVIGVSELLYAAHYHSVPFVIQISTADVCCGDNANYYAAENTISIPKQPLRLLYARSKYQAELIVSKADGRFLGDTIRQMRTLILRPTILYGEQDTHFVPNAMLVAQDCRGVLPRVSNIFTRIQPCYAGNAAWACIRAKHRITIDASIGGEEFFITDDTAICDPFDFVQPYLTRRGYRVSEKAIPFFVLTLVLTFLCFLLRLLRPILKKRLPYRYQPPVIQYFCTTHFFNRNKATLRLDYEPLFTPEEADARSAKYYETCSLNTS